MKAFLRNQVPVLLFLLCFGVNISGLKAQPLLNTSWQAVGQTAQTFQQAGIDTMIWQFMPNDALHWYSPSGSSAGVIYSIWNQTGAQSFTFHFQDTSANTSQLTTLCPSTAVTTISAYHISGDTLHLDNVSGGCSIITSLLANGTWKRQSATGVPAIAGSDASVIVYPQPAQNTVWIRTGSFFAGARLLNVYLYDQNGRKIRALSASPGTIQLSGLNGMPAGVYALHLVSDAGLMTVRELVIAR